VRGQLKEHPLFSVIILNYNCKKFLGACLSSVFNTSYSNYEIIFVDNNSEDGSVQFVRSRFNSNFIKVIELDKNYGFSIGNDIGAKYAKGDYLIFLNPDTKTHTDWLKELVSVLEKDSLIGIAQPKILLMDKRHFDSAGGYINPYGLVWVRGVGEEDQGQYNDIEEIFCAKGAALAIRRRVWEELGGFDSIFFIYNEETDLCWRAWNHGYKVVYVPRAKVFHLGGAVLNNIPHFVKYHEAKGRPILLIKNHSLKDAFRYVPFTIILQLFNVIRQLIKRRRSSAIAVFKGTLWCVTHFPKIWRARKKAQGSKKDMDRRRGFRIMKKSIGITLG
jgi:hypothetical protein